MTYYGHWGKERLFVDLDDAVHAGEVDDDPAVGWDRCALRAGATAPGHHGHAVLVGDAHHIGHLLVVNEREAPSVKLSSFLERVDKVFRFEEGRAARHVDRL